MTGLEGKVALVAGATRGAGRGIARGLGEAGATVYCTGRSTRAHAATAGRAEIIEETAEMVDAAGGKGIAVQVDHLDEAQVRALFERIRRESGGLDIIVNDVWGGDALTEWGKPFWELDVEQGFRMMRTALHTHILTARHGAPLLLERGSGLLVEITDGDSFAYRSNLFYDLVKTSVIRLAWDFAEEFREKNVAAVAVTPGFLRSEAMLDHFGVTRETWRDAAKKDPNFLHSETPLFVGRAVAALAADTGILARSGRVFSSWGLSREFGFVDEDGSRPDWGAHFDSTYENVLRACDDGFYAYWAGGARMKELLSGSG